MILGGGGWVGKTVNIIEPLQSAPAAINKLAAFQRRDAAGRIRQTVVVDERERERERERDGWLSTLPFKIQFSMPSEGGAFQRSASSSY